MASSPVYLYDISSFLAWVLSFNFMYTLSCQFCYLSSLSLLFFINNFFSSLSVPEMFHDNHTQQYIYVLVFYFRKYYNKKIQKKIADIISFFWFCPKCVKKWIYLFLPTHISMFVFLRMNSVDIYLIFAYRDFHGEGVTVTSSWIALKWYS